MYVMNIGNTEVLKMEKEKQQIVDNPEDELDENWANQIDMDWIF